MQNFQEVLQDIYKNVITISDKGSVASYIPELAEIDKHNFE